MYDMFRVRRWDVGDVSAQSDIWISVSNVSHPVGRGEEVELTQKLPINRKKLFDKPAHKNQIMYPIRRSW